MTQTRAFSNALLGGKTSLKLKKKEWNAKKWTQYKQPLFSLVAKENREQQLDGVITPCLHGHGNKSIERKHDTGKRGQGSRITITCEREADLTSWPWQGQFTCYTKRKRRVYDTGGYRRTELKNTRPCSTSGPLHFLLCPQNLNNLIPYLLQFFTQMPTSQ